MERAVFISVITSNNTEEQVIEYLDELREAGYIDNTEYGRW